jgi:hypothetical protein
LGYQVVAIARNGRNDTVIYVLPLPPNFKRKFLGMLVAWFASMQILHFAIASAIYCMGSFTGPEEPNAVSPNLGTISERDVRNLCESFHLAFHPRAWTALVSQS